MRHTEHSDPIVECLSDLKAVIGSAFYVQNNVCTDTPRHTLERSGVSRLRSSYPASRSLTAGTRACTYRELPALA